MPSGTSFSERRIFYPTLWKKNMTRFWPIWAVYGAGWLLALPLNLLLQHADDETSGISDLHYFTWVTVREASAEASAVAVFFFSILAAMAVFSYLYNNRSAGFLHTLPVCREGLFLTNYLSGFSFLLFPSVLVFGVTLLAELARGCLDVGTLGLWLLAQVLLTLFFYSFAVFCAMFTGHTLALPVFYGILSGLAYGLVNLINMVLSEFVFGYQSADLLQRLGNWLSPLVLLYQRLSVQKVWDNQGEILSVQLHGVGYLVVYAAIGFLLAVAALLIYRKRNLESAGDVVTIRWVRPVFKYGMAFCSAMTLGLFLYYFFTFGMAGRAWRMLAFLVLGGGVGYFAAEMLLQKAFLVFRQSWKGYLGFSLIIAILIVGMELDLTGFESRVPAAEKVLSVQISDVSSAPYDSADYLNITAEDNGTILTALALHQSVVDNRRDYEQEDTYGMAESQSLPDGTVLQNVQTRGWVNFTLRYELLGGGSMIREYGIPVTDELLADPKSPASLMEDLLNRPENVLGSYFTQELLERKTSNISVNLLNTNTGEYDSYPVPAEYRETLMAAIKADISAERLGRRYLLDNEERLTTCYYNDLDVEFVPVEVQGELQSTSRTITLQTTAEETLSVLREAGVVDENHVLETQAQRSIRTADDNWEKDYYAPGSTAVERP